MDELPIDAEAKQPPDYDLGGGVTASWWAGRLIVKHPRPDTGEQCTGTVVFSPYDHTLVSRDPLTIQPSLDCPNCPWHVFIIEGRVR